MWEFPRGRVCFPVNLAAVFVVMRFSQKEGWLCTEGRVLLLSTVQVDHIQCIEFTGRILVSEIHQRHASICSLRS